MSLTVTVFCNLLASSALPQVRLCLNILDEWMILSYFLCINSMKGDVCSLCQPHWNICIFPPSTSYLYIDGPCGSKTRNVLFKSKKQNVI